MPDPAILYQPMTKLHEYGRSSASYRTRIALNLKGVEYDRVEVHLVRGEQSSAAYLAINPQGRVPALVLDGGETLIQSPAILEWLEEAYPAPPLLPRAPLARAHVRAMAALIGCDIHPLNNLGPLSYLRAHLHADDEAVNAWYAHWITLGFTALEQMVATPYCAGETLSLADVYLVPQVANARRMKVELEAFPKILAIDALCVTHPAFARAAP